MKIGKLPEPMLIRSVLKEVEHRRDEVLVGPAVGQDCAVVELGEGEVFVLSSDPITVPSCIICIAFTGIPFLLPVSLFSEELHLIL